MPAGGAEKAAEKWMNRPATMDMKISSKTWEKQGTASKLQEKRVILEKGAQEWDSQGGSVEKRPLPVTPGEYTEIKEEDIPLYTEAQNIYEGYMVPQSEKAPPYITIK